MNPNLHLLWSAFEDGNTIEIEAGSFTLTCQDAGMLLLPTGKMVACDPVFDLFQPAYSFRVEPGEYPVFVSLTRFREVALLMVQFLNGKPVSWKLATPNHFSVDSATAAIMDAKLVRMLQRATKRDRFEKHWHKASNAMEMSEDSWCNTVLHSATNLNVVSLQTYGGDGTFQSYLGMTRQGTIACLVIDFLCCFPPK